jgi:hypothetical protein
LRARQAATARPEMPAPIMVMLSEMGTGREDIAWIGVIGDHGKQGNISDEGAGVNVGTA